MKNTTSQLEKTTPLNDEEQRQMHLGEEAAEIESARESGEDQRGSENGGEEIEAAVPQTLRQRCALHWSGGHNR